MASILMVAGEGLPFIKTGGLADTIINYTKPDGTGFFFEKYDSGEFLKTITSAIKVYKTNKQKWYTLMRNGMAQDYSWTTSAQRYMDLYKSITGK